MKIFDWAREIKMPVTICDKAGIVIYMNNASIALFEKDGGEKLIGTNLLECHPEPARTKLVELLKSGDENTYTIDKNGKRKMIHQFPFYEDGVYGGFVEMSIILPEDMNHFVRQ